MFKLTSNDLDEARKLSIKDYLEYNDVKLMRRGSDGRYVCLSPITNEKHPSFYVYPENKFFDYSSGTGGDVITLVRLVEGYDFAESIKYIQDLMEEGVVQTETPNRNFKAKATKYGKFDIVSYKATEKLDNDIINAYSDKRKFAYDSYQPSFFKNPRNVGKTDNVTFVKEIGPGFVQTDHFGNVCGIKIRSLSCKEDPKFILRGKPGFYVLENKLLDDNPTLYIVESETSASSFMRYLRAEKKSAIVISFGGVNSVPHVLPFKWEYITKRKLIIDFDGDRELWDSRARQFKHLNAEPIMIETPKGIDLGVLSANDEIGEYLKT